MISAYALGPPAATVGLPAGLAGRAVLRPLGPEDFDRVRALNDTVIAGIGEPDMAVLESDGFLRAHLGPAGATVGVEAGGALVACAVLGLPAADDPYNFGFDIGADAASRAAVAHLDGCMVLPAWRGHGLQRTLTDWRLARAAEAGRQLVLSTASPRNVYSLANLLGAGLAIVALKTKFGGRLRFILRRRLGAATPRVAAGEIVPLDDVERLRALLSAGAEGVALETYRGAPAIRLCHAGGQG